MTFDLVDFHERAVRTQSHEDVGEMRGLLVDELVDAGADPRVDDAGNILATRGAGAPHYVLNTHLDTVPPHVPYSRRATPPGVADSASSAERGSADRSSGQSPPAAGDVVRGRGACDAKGPLAALLAAFLDVEPAGRVTLAVTPDEERLSTGAAALDLDADGYIVGEPTGRDVCNAAKGRFEGTVTVSGSAAHAAAPDSGVNAIRATAPLLEALDTFDEAHGPGTHDSLGAPTLQATTVEGGATTNQVPERCRFTVDRRSVPPETAAGFRDALESHLRDVALADVDVAFALTDRETPFLEAFHTDASDPLVAALCEASGGAVRPFAAATEASYFARDAPTVVFGPGVLADDEGAVAHAEREYIRLSEIEAAAVAIREALDRLV